MDHVVWVGNILINQYTYTYSLRPQHLTSIMNIIPTLIESGHVQAKKKELSSR